MKGLYTAKCKTFMNDIEGDKIKWKNNSIFIDQKTKMSLTYCCDVHITQSDLQIQHNPYQNSSFFFFFFNRSRKHKSKILLEP